MRRRDFLTTTLEGAALLGCFPASLAGVEREQTSGPLERRPLGRTGEKLSVIGFGGIVVKDTTPKEAADCVAEAIDRGVNYFDVAPTYGNAEERLGPALVPYRQSVFLACKTTQRHARGVADELEASLKKLRTDHFDLYQCHAVTTREDVEQIFAPKGAMDAFQAARKAGKIRFIGFSAHSVEAALALLDRFDFDSILFPVNFGTWHAGDFGPQVLELAARKKVGILALKALAKGPWPEGAPRTHPKCWYQPLSDPEEARLGLRFTLSHPVTAAIPPGDKDLFKTALRLASEFEPIAAEEARRIKEMAREGKPIFRYPRWS